MTSRTAAQSTAQGDSLIGTRCGWEGTQMWGVRRCLIVLMFAEKLIVSVECASKLGSHCLSVTEDKWGVMSFQSVPLTQTLFLWGGERSPGESAWQLKKSIWIMCIIFALGKNCLALAVSGSGFSFHICCWWLQGWALVGRRIALRSQNRWRIPEGSYKVIW